MNLIKNVDGDWSIAKERVRQDFDKVQRNFNDLQAQFAALLKQVNTPAVVPPAVITSANTVTTFDADFLRSVATKPGSGLTGKGTVTDPLGLNAAVTVAAAGALSGDGTSGSPLAVKVDGVTVTINGGNQLAMLSQVVYVATLELTPVGINSLDTIPQIIIPAVPSRLILPIAGIFQGIQQQSYNLARSGNLIYTSQPGTTISQSFTTSLNAIQSPTTLFMLNNPTSTVSSFGISDSVSVKGNAANTGGTGPPNNTASITVFYLII